jgi:hypothetical protein
LLESDPAACDLIVQLWQTFTSNTARLAESSATFARAKFDLRERCLAPSNRTPARIRPRT